ncbi:MAG: hypothetical protein HS111_30500 [Kofleriaceae bacterium]|nr:hypothetical protein [Kofleriaceae bacterium]
MSRRVVIITTAIAAAACFLLAVQGGWWWTIGEVGVGPVSTQRCFGGDCQRGTLAWTGGSEVWARAGVATWAAGMVAGLVLVALAGAVAARRAGKLAAAVALIATMTAIVAGGVFVTQRPELPGLELARGTWFYAAAIVAALLAAVTTLRARGPSAP